MKSIVEKKVGPDLMLYDGQADSVHILNPVAQMIYEMHRQGLEVENISEALQSHFEIPAGQALVDDIRKAIQDMVSRGLFDQ